MIAPASASNPLRILAIDNSTSTLSLALGIWEDASDAPAHVWQHDSAGAAQASVEMIAAVMRLVQQARVALRDLHAIAFGAGPGAFTSLRAACAVTQGLALGAGLRVLPVDSLLATAQNWRLRQQRGPWPQQGSVWALLDARMNEIYAAQWQWHTNDRGALHWQESRAAALYAASDFGCADKGFAPGALYAGNVGPVYAPQLRVSVDEAQPDARSMLHLAPALLRADALCDPALALPRYVRNKVAQTTAERAAARRAAS